VAYKGSLEGGSWICWLVGVQGMCRMWSRKREGAGPIFLELVDSMVGAKAMLAGMLEMSCLAEEGCVEGSVEQLRGGAD
jgi:hypothetical protein